MAVLQFTGARIAPLRTLSVQIILSDGAQHRRSNLTPQIQVGQYSNGVVRVVGTGGFTEQISYTVASMDRFSVGRLREYQGEAMLYRDGDGNRDVGTLSSVICDYGRDSVGGTFGPVQFSLLAVTLDERSFTQ